MRRVTSTAPAKIDVNEAAPPARTRIEQIPSGRWVVRSWRGGIIEKHDERYEAERAFRRLNGG